MLRWSMLVVYIVLTAYLIWRSLHCFKGIATKKSKLVFNIVYSLLFVGMCTTLFLGALLPHGAAHDFFHGLANIWLGSYLYLLTFTVSADIVVIILKFINRKRTISILSTSKGHIILACVVLFLTVGFEVYGSIHATKMYTNKYEATVKKDGGKVQDLNVVLISDFHIGYSIGCDMMQEMVDRVNKLNPDIVVVAGDIIDNDYDAIDNPEKEAKILRGLHSKYGTYAVYGNHDVIETLVGGFATTPRSQAFRDKRLAGFLEKCNIHIMEDESVLIDDSFYLVGRIDGERAGDGTINRSTTKKLVQGLDKTKPILLLSHEPDEIEKNEKAGVDVMLNGHTHGGQFFPLTVSQPFAWKNYWGYKKFGDMHNYVSSGIGIYGPKLRVFTDSEIMQIKLHFTKED